MANHNVEILSVVAALISAIGTMFAARAAHKSAESAKRTEEAAASSERRSSLSQIALAAVEVITEAKRITAKGEETKVAYKDLAVFAGSAGSSRLELFKKKIEEKVKLAAGKSDHARLFVNPFENLGSAPVEEIDRVQTTLLANHRELSAILGELNDECAFVQGQCAEYRQKAIGASRP